MSNYVISGGKKLSGDIVVNPSKNAALVILMASLLNEKKTIIKNLPKIEEVFRILEVLQSVGVNLKMRGERTLEITPPKTIDIKNINKSAAMKTRTVILLMGTLIHKFKKFDIPMSGGCKLGRRTIMPHIYALEDFGIKIENFNDRVTISRSNLKPVSELIMYESGDLATVNAIMTAALIPGKTKIKFASANYQVRDLCHFLTKLGIKIEGIGSTTIVIHGKNKISKDISHHVVEDPIEAMSFIAMAAVTKSEITIKRCPIDFLELELFKLKKMNFNFKILKRYKNKSGAFDLVDIKTYPSNIVAPVEKLYGRPFPGLNIDNLPLFVPIAMQAKGKTLIHDWVYENRAIYYTELNRLGAKITLADPHRVFIEGPTKLTPTEVMCPAALRPSTIILLTMLATRGKSILRNIYAIERGHEDLCGRLTRLGADISALDEV